MRSVVFWKDKRTPLASGPEGRRWKCQDPGHQLSNPPLGRGCRVLPVRARTGDADFADRTSETWCVSALVVVKCCAAGPGFSFDSLLAARSETQAKACATQERQGFGSEGAETGKTG